MSRLILVLGCHRSGTSLAAKSLECLGVSLGDNADWSGPDNPQGFREDRDILALNERLLYYLNSGWDEPAPIRDFKPIHRYLGPAITLLAAKLHRYPLFGLKEPRMCRLLPFWRQVFAEVGCDVSVLHVVRDPAAVVASLRRRNGMTARVAYDLWLEYVERQYADADPSWLSWTIDYAAMVREPSHIVRQIGAALDLRMDETVLQEFAGKFVRREDPAALRFFQYLPLDVADEWERIRGMVA